MQNILVIGAGLMGSGIAQVCAQAGLTVYLNDADNSALEKAKEKIAWSVGKFIEKGKLEEDRETIISRITLMEDFSLCAGPDLVMEAVFEDLDLKKEIFSRLDKTCRETALFASNTSAIPITELASATSRPDRFLGLHFFSPVPMMQVVEVIRGAATSSQTFEAGEAFVRKINKEPILVKKDVPGFIINRINFPASIEAMRLVERGVATVEDVDKGLRLGAGRRMGIFETGDMVGLDITYGALMAKYKETGDPRWHPPLLLRRKVKAGHLGRKTGKGWYEYDKDGKRKEK